VIRATHATFQSRENKSKIIIIGSEAVRFGYPSGSAYVSSKFALEGLTESMAYELEQCGVKVVLVEPGFISTNFGENMVIAQKAHDPNSPYAQMMIQRASSVVTR
jgi:NAD(P)-dependent dehydrogenase (short-subunit alcohol dehydrogenase family)